jgi:hypothetical protein
MLIALLRGHYAEALVKTGHENWQYRLGRLLHYEALASFRAG